MRCRQWIAVIAQVRRLLRDQKLDSTNPFRIADSAPITLMTYTRGKRSQSAIGSDYFGVITSKKAKCFGLHLHTTVTDEQLIDEWIFAPASVHDKTALDALLLESHDLVVFGDKAYNDQELEDRLWDKRRIQLFPIRCKNQQ